MRLGHGTWLNLLAAATVAFLLPGAAGRTPFSREIAQGHGVSAVRFHAHKRVAERAPDPACAGTGCHVSSPHRKGGAAAFLNLHDGFASCLSCHGKEFEKRWTVSVSDAGRSPRLSYPAGDRQGDPHEVLGAPAGCERCHSESGKERLVAAGWKEIPQGFVSPIPMRMLLGGGRNWVPDAAR